MKTTTTNFASLKSANAICLPVESGSTKSANCRPTTLSVLGVPASPAAEACRARAITSDRATIRENAEFMKIPFLLEMGCGLHPPQILPQSPLPCRTLSPGATLSPGNRFQESGGWFCLKLSYWSLESEKNQVRNG